MLAGRRDTGGLAGPKKPATISVFCCSASSGMRLATRRYSWPRSTAIVINWQPHILAGAAPCYLERFQLLFDAAEEPHPKDLGQRGKGLAFPRLASQGTGE